MTITELAIKRPTIVVVFFSFLAVMGIFGFVQLKYELMPKMTLPYVTIITPYPGASPNEVETSVTKVIEDAITGLNKVTAVRSTSSEGRSLIMIEFEMSADIDLVLPDAERKVNAVLNRLPTTALKPIISKIAFDELPVVRLSVKSNMPDRAFFQYVKDKIQPRLARLDGVGDVLLFGGEEREIKINIDALKLKAYGLSIGQVTQTIKASNADFPTGNVKDMDEQYVVRIAGKFLQVEDLRQLIVARSKMGGDVKLSDIAEVQDGSKEITTINRLNGSGAIGIQIQKQSDGNTVEVSQEVRKEIKKMEKDYKDINLHFEIPQDAAIYIMDSANAVKSDLLFAILLVAFVMLIFLHSFRNSFIVMVAIPSSLVSTFFLMFIFDFSLNIMTLLAMSLVIGILVDDSIVVLENIHRHLGMGDTRRNAALKGRNEIGFAALSITMVDVVVFVPLAFITGVIGNFLRQYALVVVFSTLMSLIVSFTITPMLASRFLKNDDLNTDTLMGKFGTFIENKFQYLARIYRRVLSWALRNGWKIVFLAVILFISSLLLPGLGFIGTEFMPQADRGEFSLIVELEPGASFQNTNFVAQQVEKVVAGFPEVERILTSVGTTSEGLFGQAVNNTSEIMVTLVDKKKRSKPTDVLSQQIKRAVQKIPGTKVRVNLVSMMGSATRPPIQFLVTGTNFADVHAAAKQVQDSIATVKGTTDVRLSSEEGKPELKVVVDRKKLAAFGLTIFDVGNSLRIALTGDDESKFREGITEYDIRIMLDQFERTNPEDVGNLVFTNNKGQQFELKQFADIILSLGPTKLERENRITSINVFAGVFGRSSGDIATDIKKKLENIKFDGDAKWETAGEQKTMAESFLSLAVAILIAILFVYMIMIALYDSYLYPFVVLFSIPVAMIGAFYGLSLTMKTLSIYSILGLIMLVGLVAKNAILLVDRTNQMRVEKGLSTFDALIEAGQTRLRPILMTTFSMVMGMMPIALSKSAGSEAKTGLAVVLIGGLLSSMFLTLVLVPVVYIKMDTWKTKISNRVRKIFKIEKTDEDLSME